MSVDDEEVDRPFAELGILIASFQGGHIILEGFGCPSCGKGFWVEGADHKIENGSLCSCPNPKCSALRLVNRGS